MAMTDSTEADIVEFKSKAQLKAADLSSLWGVSVYFSHAISDGQQETDGPTPELIATEGKSHD